jgi:hypothetical protein
MLYRILRKMIGRRVKKRPGISFLSKIKDLLRYLKGRNKK